MLNPKVLNVIGAYDGCALWRIVFPTEELLDHNYPCAYRLKEDEHIDAQVKAADIVTIGRIYWLPGHEADMLRWFDTLHGKHDGKRRLVITEVDDDTITEESKAHTILFHHEWTEDDAERHRIATREAMMRCEAITTTTQPLADLYKRELGVPTYVLPNSIRWGAWRRCFKSNTLKDVPKDKIIIGWAGGWRVKGDLNPMIEAWNIIASKYSNVYFVMAGSIHPEHILALPKDRVTFRKWVHANVYPVQYSGFDIACCPLSDIPFNRMKSPCKAIEAGAAECAVVASPTVYDTVIDHGKNGLIAWSVDDWVNSLSMLIEDEKTRNLYARRWAKKVEQRYNVERNCWQWVKVWREVYAAGPREFRESEACNLDADTLSRSSDLVAV